MQSPHSSTFPAHRQHILNHLMTTLSYKIPKHDARMLARRSMGGRGAILGALVLSMVLAGLRHAEVPWMEIPYSLCLLPLIFAFTLRELIIRDAHKTPLFALQQSVKFDDNRLEFNIPTGTWSLSKESIDYLGVHHGYHQLRTGHPEISHLFVPDNCLSSEQRAKFEQLTRIDKQPQ